MKIEKREELYSALSEKASKIMLLGSGEIGKEVIIEAMRMGFYTIAVDRYDGAPGQQVAHKYYAGSMKDEKFLRDIIEKEKPDYIVPEIEAINLDTLKELETEGYNVVPNANAAYLAMQRERIREAIVKTGVSTSKYEYCETLEQMKMACDAMGYPCWAKAIMDSSGHGSSKVNNPNEVEAAFNKAKNEARGSGEKIIVEQNVAFDIEVTQLVIRHVDKDGKIKTSFCRPIGQYQTRGGDYHSSWHVAEISEEAEKKCYETAKKITDALGGLGIFGCEVFVKGDDVWANEISPRPHDTGMVTFASHQIGYSQAALHVRAITGMPIPTENRLGYSVVPIMTPAATHVILSPVKGDVPVYGNLYDAIDEVGVTVLFFGKNTATVNRRLGVVLAVDKDVEKAKEKAERVAHKIMIKMEKDLEYKKQDSNEKHLFSD